MILIADGGSTKAHWSIIDAEKQYDDFYSEGYNPFYVEESYIVPSLSKSLPPSFDPLAVKEVYFYGAGVHNEEKAEILRTAFAQIFKSAHIVIEHDMLAVCRALLGDEAGFAAILGTGTNSCLYDGKNVEFYIESASYILGDEGSGCYMGKKLLKDVLRNTLPADLREAFDTEYKTNNDEIMDAVYTRPLANRYCAGFTKFLGDHISHPYCINLVKSSFRDFFNDLVSLYPNYKILTFNCVGSIGFYFRSLLDEVAAEFGMKTGVVVKGPIEGLRAYHSQPKTQIG